MQYCNNVIFYALFYECWFSCQNTGSDLKEQQIHKSDKMLFGQGLHSLFIATVTLRTDYLLAVTSSIDIRNPHTHSLLTE